ncbi:sensor histidine kinase [Umezawaea tangerina]|uniref:histidine kinase n=1 Tax=Umezawaea tangerina TaxID=84725 RepID=A0A2T0T1Q0_9PSEU|nr:HAMP domain-containing sensor histidine kinase [Umezawaea tangerina]PRY39553.1 two-component system sensor histidine kinase MtrB [Umezawaea tangerina]
MRALGLRSRLVVAFAVVSVLTGLGVAAVSYLMVRDLVLQSAQDAMVEQLRADVSRQTTPAHPPTRAELDTLALRYNAVVVFGNLHANGNGIRLEDVPDHLRGTVHAGRSVVVQRAELAGLPYAFVGTALRASTGRSTGIELYRAQGLTVQQGTINELPALARMVILLALLPAVLLALIAARGVLRPVRDLRAAALRVTGGHLDTRSVVRGSDELTDLARSFNTMTAELERTVAELRRMEENARRFVADVSHELRTPLTAMTAVAEVLDDEALELTGDAATAAGMVSGETRRLRRLVEDLVEISRFDAGVASLRPESADIGEMIASTLHARGWTGRVETTLPAEVVAPVDRRRLDVVVANLVGNALRHGDAPVTVDLVAVGPEVVITVTDAGTGLPEEVLPHVFERFYKADSARARSEGSGLGLAIAWENAHLHGGSLAADNSPGGGARFTVRLPRGRS